jgi:serine/threonine protein kinase
MHYTIPRVLPRPEVSHKNTNNIKPNKATIKTISDSTISTSTPDIEMKSIPARSPVTTTHAIHPNDDFLSPAPAGDRKFDPTLLLKQQNQKQKQQQKRVFLSPVTTIHAIHPQMVINKLKPIKDDFLNYVNGAQDGSISQLSLCVNDSAGDTTFEQCYDKQDILGEGGFAIVYRCQHKVRGNHYAVKEIFHENYEAEGENVKEEIESLKRLREHPYIVRLLDVFTEVDRTYVIMEELKGGDLLERLGKKEFFSEPDARKLSRRLLEALHFCHKKKIAHRDIKPENILLASRDDDTHIKLADFGCAHKVTGPNCLRTLLGSPQYVAPELYTHEDGYDERCDLWSAAVVIYCILGGYAPFDGEGPELPGLICEGWVDFHPKYWKHVSQAAKDLILSLLQVDPEKRVTLEGALDSDWLRRRDRESIMAHSMSNLSESVSAFDAWLRRQNESNNSLDFDIHECNGEVDEEDDEDEESESGDESEDDSDDDSSDEDSDDDSDSEVKEDSSNSLSLDDL